MNKTETSAQTNEVVAQTQPPSIEEIEAKMCQGVWRLKPSVLLRNETDGGILFDPEADSLSVVNNVGIALLRWRPQRICFTEWCEALHAHYQGQTDLAKVQGDLKKFLGQIFTFTEPCDGIQGAGVAPETAAV